MGASCEILDQKVKVELHSAQEAIFIASWSSYSNEDPDMEITAFCGFGIAGVQLSDPEDPANPNFNAAESLSGAPR